MKEYPFGHLSEGDIEILRKYAEGKKLAVNLGVYLGLSSIIISEHAEKVYAVDLFEDFAGGTLDYQGILNLLSKYPNITTVKGNSHDPNIVVDGVDFIFIDADHSYESVKADFETWYPNITKGGYALFHDSAGALAENWGVRDYFKDMKKKYGKMRKIESKGSTTVWKKGK